MRSGGCSPGSANTLWERCGDPPVRGRPEVTAKFPRHAAIKMLWLAICNIEDKRARECAKEQGRTRETKRKAEGRLVEGQITTNWKQGLSQLVLVYPDRIDPHPNHITYTNRLTG